MIYFDNAATTYPKPDCMYEAMDFAQKNYAFNAGRGSYKGAKKAHEIIEECRNYLCKKANAESLIFTPSATHSINMVVLGISLEKDDIVYCSPYDHNAIVRTLYENSRKMGFVVKQIPLNKDLSIDFETFKFECIKNKPKAIFCTHISNVTGYILPIDEISKIASENNSLFIVDGAQAFGLVPVDLKKSNIDYYIFAGHKTLYGPFGIAGILCKDAPIKLKESFYGGTGSDSLNIYMPLDAKYEPSSPNVVACYALLESSKFTFKKNMFKHEVELYNYLYDKLSNIDDVIIYQAPNNQHTGILSINIKGYKSNEVALILENEFDIAVRSDYHCTPFIHEFLNSIAYLGTVRISLGYFNNIEQCDHLIDALEEIVYDF